MTMHWAARVMHGSLVYIKMYLVSWFSFSLLVSQIPLHSCNSSCKYYIFKAVYIFWIIPYRTQTHTKKKKKKKKKKKERKNERKKERKKKVNGKRQPPGTIQTSFNMLLSSLPGVTFNTSKNNFVVDENLTVAINFTISNACEENNSSLDIVEVSYFIKSNWLNFCTLFHEHGSCMPSLKNPSCTCDPQTQQYAVKTKVRCSQGEEWKLSGQLENGGKFEKTAEILVKRKYSHFLFFLLFLLYLSLIHI